MLKLTAIGAVVFTDFKPAHFQQVVHLGSIAQRDAAGRNFCATVLKCGSWHKLRELAELGRARLVKEGKKKLIQLNPVLLSGAAS